jgi:hypothetical protein
MRLMTYSLCMLLTVAAAASLDPAFAPTGVFTVLQKQKEHRSTIYDGAPMPYMERTGDQPLADHALVLTTGASSGTDPYVPDPTKLH